MKKIKISENYENSLILKIILKKVIKIFFEVSHPLPLITSGQLRFDISGIFFSNFSLLNKFFHLSPLKWKMQPKKRED